MASNKKFNFASVYVPVAVANLFNVGTTTGSVGFTGANPYAVISHILLMNKDTSPHIVTLYKGATGGSAGGTEFAFDSISVGAQSSVNWYGQARFDSGDFLTGVADIASKVTINIEGEIGLA